jgi:transposase
MRLLRIIIAAYHTDADTGEVDLDARLIPGIGEPNKGGQGNYRRALRDAQRAEGLPPEQQVSPHHLRKSLATDLAHTDLDAFIRRRMHGHIAGSDVHDRDYLLDDPRLLGEQRPAAEHLDERVADEVGELLIPTDKRPQFGVGNPLIERTGHAEMVLRDAWGLDTEAGYDPLYRTEQVAEELDVPRTTARRWMRDGKLPVEETTDRFGGCVRGVRCSQVRLFMAQLEKRPTLADLAGELAIDYHEVWRTMQRLNIDPERGPRGEYRLDDGQAVHLRQETHRIAGLHRRALTVTETARELGITRYTVYKWLERSELERDPGSDSSGAAFVTRASVDAKKVRQEADQEGRRRKEEKAADALTLNEVADLIGVSARAVRNMARAGNLKAVFWNRRRHITRGSLRDHRPATAAAPASPTAAARPRHGTSPSAGEQRDCRATYPRWVTCAVALVARLACGPSSLSRCLAARVWPASSALRSALPKCVGKCVASIRGRVARRQRLRGAVAQPALPTGTGPPACAGPVRTHQTPRVDRGIGPPVGLRRLSTRRAASRLPHPPHPLTTSEERGMRRLRRLAALVTALLVTFAAMGTAGASEPCTTVDTSRGERTAHLVNPGTVTGDVDGAGCDIAVYFDEAGTVDGAEITVGDRSREHFGVFADGTSVDVRDADFADAFVHIYYADGADGTIEGNTIEAYERGAIVASGGGTHARIRNNDVLGDGDRGGDGWAQNGIQVSYGATGVVTDNRVEAHRWGGTGWQSSGILVFESDEVQVTGNALDDNEVGVGIESWAWRLTPTSSADANRVSENDINASGVGISVASIAWSLTNDDPTADDNKVVNNTVTDTQGDDSIVVSEVDNHDDYDPSTEHTKLIRNRVDAGVSDGGSESLIQPTF